LFTSALHRCQRACSLSLSLSLPLSFSLHSVCLALSLILLFLSVFTSHENSYQVLCCCYFRCGHENLPASLVEPYLQGFISKLTTGEAEERAAADARAARPTDEELGLGYFKELRENFGPGGLHNNGGSDSNGINGIGDGESGEGGILEEDVRNLVGGYELANNGYSGCVLC